MSRVITFIEQLIDAGAVQEIVLSRPAFDQLVRDLGMETRATSITLFGVVIRCKDALN